MKLTDLQPIYVGTQHLFLHVPIYAHIPVSKRGLETVFKKKLPTANYLLLYI